jgi:hypothetical protein
MHQGHAPLPEWIPQKQQEEPSGYLMADGESSRAKLSGNVVKKS